MTDAEPTAERLTELEERWQAKPQSRVFLQLAEEYRRRGQQERALEVLTEGLKRHPGHVSALVALGRCQLELGRAEAAVATLEGVVEEDATHLVAGKLLVEAHIQREDAVRARRRLDLYQQLNPADGEIAQLRRRIESLQLADPEPLFAPSSPAVDEEGTAPGAPWAAAQEADEAAPRAEGAALAFEEVREPGEDAAETAVEDEPPAAVEVAGGPEVPAPEEAAGGGEAVAERSLLVAGGEDPFPGAGADWGSYLAGLSAEGIFPPVEEPPAPQADHEEVEAAAPEATPEEEPAKAAEPGAPPEVAAIEEEIEEEDETLTLWRHRRPAQGAVPPEGRRWAADEADEEELAAPLPLPAVAPATVTLADLYLRQGHRREAERIYRRVLEKDPGNEPARQALAALGAAAPDAASPEASAAEEAAAAEPSAPRASEPWAATPPAAEAASPESAEPATPEPAALVTVDELLADDAEAVELAPPARKALLLKRYLHRLRRGEAHDVP